jgi:tetratricopeptide (TPR) repeat protein
VGSLARWLLALVVRTPVLAAGVAALAGCAWTSRPPSQVTPDSPETYSLFGEPLLALALSPESRDTLEARLARARADYTRDPTDADALIWLGRRTAYLGRFRAAVAIFSEGITVHRRDARFYRHRGHRYITLRRFASAIEDLETAAELVQGRPDEIEPDGIPNARNLPTSTLQSNIGYHLGLARYLTANYGPAHRAYQECLTVSKNPDMLCATTYWLHRSLMRLGRREDARRVLATIHAGMDLIENHDYYRLLLLEKGLVEADTLLASARRQGGVPLATVGYGVATWWLAQGRQDSGLALLREVVRAGHWPAFGHIAAEADLHRLGLEP